MQQGVQQHQSVASGEEKSGDLCSNRTRIEPSNHCACNNATIDNGDNRVTGKLTTTTTVTSQTSDAMASLYTHDYPISSNGQNGSISDNSLNSRHGITMQGPTEGREAPVQQAQDNSPPQSALLHPCLPASPQHSSPSEEEPDPAEIYPHHKKFRRQRKRAAAVVTQYENTRAQHDDSLCSEAKKNCNTTTAVANEQSVVSTPNPIETTNPKSDSPVYDISEKEAFELSTTSDKLCRASLDLSVSSPSDTSSTADDCDVMETSDVTHELNFSYEAQASPERRGEAFAVNTEQAANTVHTCGWLQCTRQFPSLDELVNHVNDMHVRAERDVHYKCYWTNCPRRGKGFNARYKMLIHVRTHTNERPYKCALCHKSFSRLENLKIHNRSHTGERPYVCPFEGCNKAYSNSSDRFKHVRTHQEQKPYSCRMPGCDKRYTDPSSLRKHIKTHGHYYRGPEEAPNKEKMAGSSELAARQRAVEEAVEAQRGEHGDVFVSSEKLLPLSSAAYLRGFAPSDLLLSPGSSQFSSVLSAERLLELRAIEDFQHKALLDAGSLFSGLSLPRHPLLGLGLGYPLPESSHYSGSVVSLERSPSSLLMPLPHNVTDNRSYLASLGSTGSLSPGSLSDSTQSACTDSDSCGSPPLPFSRSSYDSVHATPRSSMLYSSSPSHPSLSPKQSAFSPVSPSLYPADKYSLVASRSPLISHHPRHSPVHHPYIRTSVDSETSRSSLQSSPVHRPQSPVFRRCPRPERPLDLSHPGSPMSAREESPSRFSPGSVYHAYELPMHCHTAPKCDLGPAFPALRLLNHA